MNIAVFHGKGATTSWNLGEGLCSILRRMGHGVVGAALPRVPDNGQIPPYVFEKLKAELPTVEVLKGMDAVIVSGLEHLAPWLDVIYGKYDWKHLGVPKAGWWHESLNRPDYQIAWENVEPWADQHFLPAFQDADWLDQEGMLKDRATWLPFGVDVDIFFPSTPLAAERFDVAFIGTVYERRAKFLQAFGQFDHPPIRIGEVEVRDLSGCKQGDTAMLLAENLRQTRIFFNLPAMSNLLVTKVYEAMACGCFVMTPAFSDTRNVSKNMEIFQQGEHLVYYRAGHVDGSAKRLRDWASEEKRLEVAKIAGAGAKEIAEHHRLDQRLTVILEKLGVRQLVQ